VATQPGSVGAGWKTELTAEARLIERRERSDQLGRHEPKGKMYFRKDATDSRLDGPVRTASACGGGGKRGQRGWLGQMPSGPIRLAGLKAKKKDF
jgi:hypothetical protein